MGDGYMGRLLVAMVVAGSSFTLAFAQEEGGVFAPENFSCTLTFTTGYMYDGVSISDQDPAVQGAMDYSHPGTGILLGLWGSRWDDGGYSYDVELGVWGGQAGSQGPIDYDVTVFYWFYPGVEDEGIEFNDLQAGVNLGHTFQDMIQSPTITDRYMWSPDYFGEEGTYNKFTGKLGLSLPFGFGLEFEAAHVDIEGGATTGNGGGMDGGDGYDWEFYRIGLSLQDPPANARAFVRPDATVLFSIMAALWSGRSRRALFSNSSPGFSGFWNRG